MAIQPITLTSSSGKKISIRARIANEQIEFSAGYQWICPISTLNTAVLFIFPHPYEARFHMHNVFVPLDIVYFDKKGNAISSDHMAPESPGNGTTPRLYGPNRTFIYALETPAGHLEKLGLDIQDLSLSLAP